jgi:RNA polymerase sigma-70 factor (ECF subfamily)
MGERLMMAVDDPPSPPSSAERERLEKMFAAHHVTVWRALRRMGLTPDAAADATQQTFLVAAERLDDIQPDSERAFLVGTALRTAHTLRRKTIHWLLDDEMDQRIAAVRDTGDVHADVELCDLAISKVNPELAEVFVLYEVAGLSSPEIAALLEIPLGSVASRLRRAREQFRVAVGRIERRLRREDKP